MLTLRLIDPDDYTVHDDGQLIGRIRYTGEHAAGLWLWTIIVPIPGASSGDAKTLDEAMARFKSVWVAFKARQGAEKLTKVFAEMNHANRPDRYRQ